MTLSRTNFQITYFKVFTCTMLAEKSMQNVSPILRFLSSLKIAITIMAFIDLQFAKFPQDVRSKFSTIKNLHNCSHSQLILDTIKYLN